MATDFFQRQSDARRSTLWLITMFCLAVAAIVGTVVVITAVVVQTQLRPADSSMTGGSQQVAIPAIAGLVTLVILLGGTLYKVLELRSGGGTRVAEDLGGRRIYPDSRDRVERRLMNIVEEMAIASGIPVPPVFMLDEPGINAFAAGYSPSDAVLGVTRGCAEQMKRDELQGIIAHEFSHILNGDMRMSIRLIGILYGILLFGMVGQLILRSFFYSGRGRSGSSGKKGGGQAILVILAIGVAAVVLGFLGTFLGNLIKAAVSRQREYLADASAVQFTRNPSGIANALKRIGGFSAGSRLQTASAAEASHMYFAQGVWEGFSGLWATHPPLPDRIRAIEPNWDGNYIKSQAGAATVAAEGAAGFAESEQRIPSAAEEVPVAVVDHAVDQVGEPTTEHRDYAAELLRQMPPIILQTVRESYGARAVVYGLLLDREPSIRAAEFRILAELAQPDVVRLVQKLQPTIDSLDVRARLPLIDLALPALRAMSQSQFTEFSRCFIGLAKADRKIDLFEWMLSQVLMRHLRPQFEPVRSPRTRYYGLQKLAGECSTLLSAVASAGNSDPVASTSFQRGADRLPELALVQQPRAMCGLNQLNDALSTLAQVSAKHRGRIVDACAAAICADEHVTWQEAELLRGISDLLDCPMPPLLVNA